MDTMRLNGDYIHFSKMDLNYLEKDDWDHSYIQKVHDATLVTAEEFDVLVPENMVKVTMGIQKQLCGQSFHFQKRLHFSLLLIKITSRIDHCTFARFIK